MTTQVRPQTPAARLETTHQILALTQRLAEAFSLESALRDRERRLPDTELHTLFSSGLGGITVPAQFGGADVSCATLAQVVSRLAQADGSIGQVPQNHFYALEVLRINGTQAQQQRLYQEVLDGVHLGNALAEFGTPNAHTRRIAAAINCYFPGVNFMPPVRFMPSAFLFWHWEKTATKC